MEESAPILMPASAKSGDSGKNLERLVALIEKLHLPPNFQLRANKRILAEGVQLAELDIEITGRVGTTNLAWLIECRDRPTEGPAPGSWIEQLVGRRDRFGLNKVTAVSTTGFSKGASAFAKAKGIDIREIRKLSPENIADWLPMRSITQIEQTGELREATIIPTVDETEECKEALQETVLTKRLSDKILRFVKTNEIVSAVTAFSAVVREKPGLYDRIEANRSEMVLTLRASYPDNAGHFVVDTRLGPVRIADIVFVGKLIQRKTEIPLLDVSEYTRAPSGEPISQSAVFPFEALNMKLSLEMHKLTGSSGETHIVLRKLGQIS